MIRLKYVTNKIEEEKKMKTYILHVLFEQNKDIWLQKKINWQ
jgi:hypothetical protein